MPTTKPKRQGIGDAPPQYTGTDKKSCSRCSCPCHHQASALPNKTDGYKLNLTFVPPGNIKLKIPIAKGDWAADLSFTAEDLPRLMRGGLFLTSTNIRVEEGYMQFGPEVASSTPDWTCIRHYTLVDLSEEPQWVASLAVWARKVEVLSRFRVGDLSPDMVFRAEGINMKRQIVYYYDSWNPSKNFNTIYDDMPMGGWWPWPRNEVVVSTEENSEKKGPNVIKQGESLIQVPHFSFPADLLRT